MWLNFVYLDRMTTLVPKKGEKYLVAIGASAGGVDPLLAFFDNTLPDGVSYVVTMHLYPHQKSQLTELIRRHSSIQVSEVEDDMFIEVNHVYVMPENKVMKIKNGKLILENRDLSIKVNMAIDIFFKSLAGDTKFFKIAIIMSGMGKDGTEGVAEIVGGGGYIIVQDPRTASEDSMPNSVILENYANLMLAPKDMPKAIVTFVDKRSLLANK